MSDVKMKTMTRWYYQHELDSKPWAISLDRYRCANALCSRGKCYSLCVYHESLGRGVSYIRGLDFANVRDFEQRIFNWLSSLKLHVSDEDLDRLGMFWLETACESDRYEETIITECERGF